MLTGHYKVPLGAHVNKNLPETVIGAAFFTPGRSYDNANAHYHQFNRKEEVARLLGTLFGELYEEHVRFESVAVTYIATIKNHYRWNVVYLLAYERIPVEKNFFEHELAVRIDVAIRPLLGSPKVHFLNEGIIIEGLV